MVLGFPDMQAIQQMQNKMASNFQETNSTINKLCGKLDDLIEAVRENTRAHKEK